MCEHIHLTSKEHTVKLMYDFFRRTSAPRLAKKYMAEKNKGLDKRNSLRAQIHTTK